MTGPSREADLVEEFDLSGNVHNSECFLDGIGFPLFLHVGLLIFSFLRSRRISKGVSPTAVIVEWNGNFLLMEANVYYISDMYLPH